MSFVIMHRSQDFCCAGAGMMLCSLQILGLQRLLGWTSLRVECVHPAHQTEKSPFNGSKFKWHGVYEVLLCFLSRFDRDWGCTQNQQIVQWHFPCTFSLSMSPGTYRSLAKCCTTCGYHLWGERLKIALQFLGIYPSNFWPKWYNISKATVTLVRLPDVSPRLLVIYVRPCIAGILAVVHRCQEI
jgi:hypothetical protein